MRHEDIRDLIGKFIDLPPEHSDFDSLSEAGLDSLGYVRVIAALQERLGIRIPSDRIKPSEFKSIAVIANLVREVSDDR